MTSRIMLFSLLFASLAGPVSTISIKIITLEDLYDEADVVAFTQVIAGEVGHLGALHILQVLEPFKSVSLFEEIFVSGDHFPTDFGIHSKQVVFLRRTDKRIPLPLDGESAARCPSLYRPGAPIYEAMYAGYSLLYADAPGYTHSPGEELMSARVDVCRRQVVLPNFFKLTYEDDSTSACGRNWVGLRGFLEYLRRLDAIQKANDRRGCGE